MTQEALLNALKSRNVLDEASAGKLQREASLSGRSVEDIIHERRLVPDERIAEIKSEELGIPYTKIDPANIPDNVLQLIPEGTVESYKVVPLQAQQGTLTVGMVHPDDQKAQEAIKFLARRQRMDLGVYVISYGDWQEVLQRYSPYQSSVQEAVQALGIEQGQGRKVQQLEETGQGEEAPIIRIFADTLKEAVQRGASDIHIEPMENYVRMRMRVDGDLHEETTLPLELGAPIVARVKVMSNLRIDETRIPQDGRFRRKIFDREIDFRVATFPTPLGEKVAIRVLDPETGLRTLGELGLVGRNAEATQKGIQKPYGMVLISGPTGSGKTTTLYAMLQFLNKENVNIVSLEDPVEYFVAGVNQSQVRPEIGYTFASGLRQILRQDPDIILVGEIRDNETAGLAMNAALTGHIVLSTLHTNNAVGVIPRLIDMGVEPFLLPAGLSLMLSQRLVPRICPDCREGKQAPESMEKVIDEALAHFSSDVAAQYQKPYTIYHSPGCAKCNGKGIVGRIAIFEVLEMTPEIASIVESGPTSKKLMDAARAQGMITLREDGVLKALQGTASLEAVLRLTAD